MRNPLKAQIGGAYETWLLVALIPLLLLSNEYIYDIITINYKLLQIIHSVAIFLIVFGLVDSIYGQGFRQAVASKLKFRSSRISKDDRKEMLELGLLLGYTTDKGEPINVP